MKVYTMLWTRWNIQSAFALILNTYQKIVKFDWNLCNRILFTEILIKTFLIHWFSITSISEDNVILIWVWEHIEWSVVFTNNLSMTLFNCWYYCEQKLWICLLLSFFIIKFYRLIVIADKEAVYNNFPIPLINRLEKHYLITSTAMSEEQRHHERELKDWAAQFSVVKSSK